jgi:hypothetical protein
VVDCWTFFQQRGATFFYVLVSAPSHRRSK